MKVRSKPVLALAVLGLLMLLSVGLYRWSAAPLGVWRLAEGFDYPVGYPDGFNYYKFRGFRAGIYPAEDWTIIGPPNSSLGAPVFAIGHGKVVHSADAGKNKGGVVIIRHKFAQADGTEAEIDSYYAVSRNLRVKSGDMVERGQQIAEIGDGNGTYVPHLRFEIRKNTAIGVHTAGYAKDTTNYHDPSQFLNRYRTTATNPWTRLVAYCSKLWGGRP